MGSADMSVLPARCEEYASEAIQDGLLEEVGSVDMSVLPARCEEDASEASQDGLLKEMGSVHMRVFCPQDAKKIILKQAKMVYWKKWAA